MGLALGIRAYIEYYLEMLAIAFDNRMLSLLARFRMVSERRQLIATYINLKRIRRANLRLIRYGIPRHAVDHPDFAGFIARARRDTLAYLRKQRKAAAR